MGDSAMAGMQHDSAQDGNQAFLRMMVDHHQGLINMAQLGQPRASTPEERARTEAVAAELRGRPTFTYFQGGELTNTIAWSDQERTFVRVFSCC